MPATILIVDDQVGLLENISLTLEMDGYEVFMAQDGFRALEILQAEAIDLIVADIAMPGMNGYQLYENVRKNLAWMHIPFLFLTARTMDSDIRYGKELGVDDYLTKPIQPEDLLATINGKLRRAQQLANIASTQRNATPQKATQAERIEVGTLTIDVNTHQVERDGQSVDLSAREFELLKLLAQLPSQVLSPERIIQHTHALETDRVDAGALLRPMIRSLRRKLGYPVGDMGCIENVRGVGYRLIPPQD